MATAREAVAWTFGMSEQEYRPTGCGQPFRACSKYSFTDCGRRHINGHPFWTELRPWLALRSAIEQAGLPCQAHGDGMTVEIGDSDYCISRCYLGPTGSSVGPITTPRSMTSGVHEALKNPCRSSR